MDSYKTKKGTNLPIISLKGKPYLQVAHRIVWFREEHPDWRIETSLDINIEQGYCIASCVIYDQDGKVLTNAHKTESRKGFKDFVEKAETGSIGRALAFIGYGTAFCADELDEGARLADAPVPVATKNDVHTTKTPENLGDYVMQKGGKQMAGKTLSEIPMDRLTSYQGYMEDKGYTKGQDYQMICKFLEQELTKLTKLPDVPEFNANEELPF